MRQTQLARAALLLIATAALATSCAPQGKRPGMVRRNADRNAVREKALREKSLRDQGNGNCPAPTKKEIPEIKAKVSEAANNFGEPVIIDQLPDGTYSLINVAANFEVSSGDINYESWQEVKTSPKNAGRGGVDQSQCTSTMVAGGIKLPIPKDGGTAFSIDSQFTIKTDEKQERSIDKSVTGFQQMIGDGKNPITKLENARTTDGIIQALSLQRPTKGKSSYQFQAATRQEPDVVTLSFNKAQGLLQIYIDMLEDTNTNRHRQIFLVYTLGTPAPIVDTPPPATRSRAAPKDAPTDKDVPLPIPRPSSAPGSEDEHLND